MTVIGIDPGLTGAVVWLQDGKVDGIYDMPTVTKAKGGHELNIRGLSSILPVIGSDALVFIERQQCRPNQGCKQAFGTGYGYGVILALMEAKQLRYELVTPQAWKKDMLNGEQSDDDGDKKAASLRVARRLFPLADLGRRKDAGRAEALLIAEWGRRRGAR